jgi:hypothetical protein
VNGPPVELRIADSDVPPWHCALIGIAYGRLHVNADRAVTAGTRVIVKFKAVTLVAIVQWCEPKDSGYRLSLSVTAEREKRRREPRLPVQQPAVIMSLSDNTSTADCTLTDVSRSGLRVRLREPLAAGTMVCVETQATIIDGEVRHCQKHHEYHEIGLEITDILTNADSPDGNIGVVEALRWKLAELIVGKRLSIARKFLR